MQIISASRRTDIPAFYGDWFIRRLRAGSVVYPNPVSGAPCRVSLAPEEVHSFVFWTKNAAPFLCRLPEIERLGIPYTFLYTITGAPDVFEPHVPPWPESLQTFQRLTDRIGPARMSWRFDPILISNRTPPEFWLSRLADLCQALAGRTERCIVSFCQFHYRKLDRRLAQLAKEEIVPLDPPVSEKRALLQQFADMAESSGIRLQVCCQDDLIGGKVGKAHCIDAEELRGLFPERPLSLRKGPTRDECGCSASRDIGVYDTCPHGCIYCYATGSERSLKRNARGHDPEAECLVPIPPKPPHP